MSKLSVSQFTALMSALDGINADVHVVVNVNVDVGVVADVRDAAASHAVDVTVTEAAAPDAVPEDAPATLRTADDFPVGSQISWRGDHFSGDGAVVKHNANGSISVSIDDTVSGSRKQVNLSLFDMNSMRLSLVSAAATAAPAAPAATASDFPVGTRISWRGARFSGDGSVIKHNADGSVSVRIDDTMSRTRKRVNLNRDDIASGRLTRR